MFYFSSSSRWNDHLIFLCAFKLFRRYFSLFKEILESSMKPFIPNLPKAYFLPNTSKLNCFGPSLSCNTIKSEICSSSNEFALSWKINPYLFLIIECSNMWIVSCFCYINCFVHVMMLLQYSITPINRDQWGKMNYIQTWNSCNV